MKMQMIPPVLNDTGDCCCQCPPNGQDGWCHCNDDYNGKGDDIENAITCDLVWTEMQANGRKKYFKVVSGSSQQNMPVVLPTASLKKRGVVQLTNDLSDREDLALTPKGARAIKTELDKEVADRVANDNALQGQLNQEKTDRANADTDLLNKINQEKTDRASADKDLSDRITQETADRKTADNALSSSITNVSNRVTSVESKANNSVTSVTSNGDATVTVTKTDGTSKKFTINNVAHATSADSATSATHATSADTATKATNADHATVADRLAGSSETGATTTYTYKKYVLTTALIQRNVDAHLIRSEQIGEGNYHITYQYSFDVTFTFPKEIGKASNIIVDAINLVVTGTGASDFGKLTTKNVIGSLEFGTSDKRTFTFYGREMDASQGSTEPPSHTPVFVQENIVVYVNDRTNIKVED